MTIVKSISSGGQADYSHPQAWADDLPFDPSEDHLGVIINGSNFNTTTGSVLAINNLIPVQSQPTPRITLQASDDPAEPAWRWNGDYQRTAAMNLSTRDTVGASIGTTYNASNVTTFFTQDCNNFTLKNIHIYSYSSNSGASRMLWGGFQGEAIGCKFAAGNSSSSTDRSILAYTEDACGDQNQVWTEPQKIYNCVFGYQNSFWGVRFPNSNSVTLPFGLNVDIRGCLFHCRSTNTVNSPHIFTVSQNAAPYRPRIESCMFAGTRKGLPFGGSEPPDLSLVNYNVWTNVSTGGIYPETNTQAQNTADMLVIDNGTNSNNNAQMLQAEWGIWSAEIEFDVFGFFRKTPNCTAGAPEYDQSGPPAPPSATGDLNAIEQADDDPKFSGTSVRIVTGLMNVKEEYGDTTKWGGTIIPKFVTGDVHAVEALDTSYWPGDVFTPNQVSGQMAATETDVDAAAFDGDKQVFGDLDAVEQADTAAFAGTIIPKFVTGTLDGTETQIDTSAWDGDTNNPDTVVGVMSAVESVPDTSQWQGAKSWAGDLDAVEQGDDATFAGVTIPKFIDGTLAATETQIDTSSWTGTVINEGDVDGILTAVEAAGDAGAFVGVKSWSGLLAALESVPDASSWIGEQVRFAEGVLAAVEKLDNALFTDEVFEMGNTIGLRDGNTGLGISPEDSWEDGAPSWSRDGSDAELLLPTALGQDPRLNNFNNNVQNRRSRLLQAISNTPAGADVVPGWFAGIDVKAGEWVWCMSRTLVSADNDNPLGFPDATGSFSALGGGSSPAPVAPGSGPSVVEPPDVTVVTGTVVHP